MKLSSITSSSFSILVIVVAATIVSLVSTASASEAVDKFGIPISIRNEVARVRDPTKILHQLPDHVINQLDSNTINNLEGIVSNFKQNQGIQSDYQLQVGYIDIVGGRGDDTAAVVIPVGGAAAATTSGGGDDGRGDDGSSIIGESSASASTSRISLDLSDLQPYTTFKSTAKCYSDDVPVPCPTERDTTLFEKYDFDNNIHIQVSKNVDSAKIDTITIRKTKRRGDDDEEVTNFSVPTTLQAIGNGLDTVFAYVPYEALDTTYMSNFKMQSQEIPDSSETPTKTRGEAGGRHLRSRSSVLHQSIHQNIQNVIDNDSDSDASSRNLKENKNKNPPRQLEECDTFREVELAVAVESSFCEKAGGGGNGNAEDDKDKGKARKEVDKIIAAVSKEYEMDGLCMKVSIVHYEEVRIVGLSFGLFDIAFSWPIRPTLTGCISHKLHPCVSYPSQYCNPNNDPYKPGVKTNKSGCGSDNGLLDEFQNYWNNNRKDVKRDLAQLMSGTGLECSGGGCVIGCAYVAASCAAPKFSYGVNWYVCCCIFVSDNQNM